MALQTITVTEYDVTTKQTRTYEKEVDMPYVVYRRTSPTNKVYIGMTRKPLEVRAKDKYKKNPHMHNAIKKYGIDNFRNEILFGNLTFEDALEIEKMVIEIEDATNREKGYNITLGGVGHERKSTPQHVRDKISATLKERYKDPNFRKEYQPSTLGMKFSEETKKKMSKAQLKRSPVIIQYDLEMKELNRYKGFVTIEKELGINSRNVYSVCIGKTYTAGGYKWRYADKENK